MPTKKKAKKTVRKSKKRFMVTCVCYGDTCDGHATSIGTATSLEQAEAFIAEDKAIFREGLDLSEMEAFTDIHDMPHEIWYGHVGENGRIYDIHEV